MQLVEGIVSGAPIWVWPLLAILIFLGTRALRDRESSLVLLMALPLLGLISVRTLQTLPQQSLVWTCWGGAYALGALVGYTLQGRWLIWRRALRVGIRGEPLTLIVMMVIFWSNFASGVVKAVNPDAIQSAAFLIPLCCLIGFSAGTFLGRPLRILRSPAKVGHVPQSG